MQWSGCSSPSASSLIQTDRLRSAEPRSWRCLPTPLPTTFQRLPTPPKTFQRGCVLQPPIPPSPGSGQGALEAPPAPTGEQEGTDARGEDTPDGLKGLRVIYPPKGQAGEYA